MIEPTETESKETLDAFIEAMIEIAEQAQAEPDALKNAPITTPVSRPNETAAAKYPNIASLSASDNFRSLFYKRRRVLR